MKAVYTKDLGNSWKSTHQSLVQSPWYKDLIWGVSIPVTQPIQLSALSWPFHVTSCDHGHLVSHSWPCHEILSNSIALNFIPLDLKKFSLSPFVCKSIWYCLSHNNQGKQLYDKKSLFVCAFPNSVLWENPNSYWCALKMSVYAATKLPHSFYTW